MKTDKVIRMSGPVAILVGWFGLMRWELQVVPTASPGMLLAMIGVAFLWWVLPVVLAAWAD